MPHNVRGVKWISLTALSVGASASLHASVARPASEAAAMARIPKAVMRLPDRQPVSVQAFSLDLFEVTNAQYQRFLAATAHPEPAFWRDGRFNQPQQPVVGVSWHDAVAYCEWAGKRLPREEEWMLAAGGPDQRRFPWGDSPPDELGGVAVANYNAVIVPVSRYTYSSFIGRDGFHHAAPVGSFPAGASPYGVHDLAGNVSEWVSGYLPPASEVEDPALYRVRKGGSWLTLQRSLAVSARDWSAPELRTSFSTGFRCAKDL
jgi:formylglycine-generating enzyme required for sulfatase activity